MSSINLSQILDGLGDELKALVSKSWTYGRSHGSTLYLFLILTLKAKKVLLRQKHRRDMMLGMENGVLLGSVVSCCSLLCIMFRAGSTGITVKNAFTL